MSTPTAEILRTNAVKKLTSDSSKREEIKRQHQEHLKKQYAYQGRKFDLVFAG